MILMNYMHLEKTLAHKKYQPATIRNNQWISGGTPWINWIFCSPMHQCKTLAYELFFNFKIGMAFWRVTKAFYKNHVVGFEISVKIWTRNSVFSSRFGGSQFEYFDISTVINAFIQILWLISNQRKNFNQKRYSLIPMNMVYFFPNRKKRVSSKYQG